MSEVYVDFSMLSLIKTVGRCRVTFLFWAVFKMKIHWIKCTK